MPEPKRFLRQFSGRGVLSFFGAFQSEALPSASSLEMKRFLFGASVGIPFRPSAQTNGGSASFGVPVGKGQWRMGGGRGKRFGLERFFF